MIDIREYLQIIRRLKDDYSEEIPDKIVHSTDGRWKVRKGWFQCVMEFVWFGVRKGWIGQNTYREYETFERYVYSPKFRNRMTTREDIDMANDLLDRAIVDIWMFGI